MAYIKYGLLAAVLLIVTALILSTPAKESIQEWQTTGPEETMETSTPPNDAIFSASPVSGPAPLTVKFYTNIAGRHPGGPFLVRFDDGSNGPVSEEIDYCNAPSGVCTSPGVN